MQEIKLKQIDKLTKTELKQAVADCFEYGPETSPVDRLAILQEAEFYTRELDRRSDSWVAFRDLILEIVVIGLIGWEIYMGYRQAADHAAEFGQQQQIFQNLESSSKATANTMTALEATTETMNGALQKQLTLFYDVSVNVLFDTEKKLVGFVNNGRTNVSIWGIRMEQEPMILLAEGRSIPPGGAFQIPGGPAYDFVRRRFPKPSEGLVPFEVFIKNGRGEEFIQHGYLGVRWPNESGEFVIQTTSIVPQSWSKVKGVSVPPSPKAYSTNPSASSNPPLRVLLPPSP
jgi:hypothetical protein